MQGSHRGELNEMGKTFERFSPTLYIINHTVEEKN